MGAITGIIFEGVLLQAGGPTSGGLVTEVWKIPASTAGDTQTLTLPYVKTVKALVGNASMTAQTTDNSIAVTTLATVAASNFNYLYITGVPNRP